MAGPGPASRTNVRSDELRALSQYSSASMLSSSSPSTEDVEVRRVDQDMINEFGRLNARKHEAREEVELEKKASDDLDDAEEGVLLADASETGAVKCVRWCLCWTAWVFADWLRELLLRARRVALAVHAHSQPTSPFLQAHDRGCVCGCGCRNGHAAH